MPTAGIGSPGPLSLYHQGNLPSGIPAAYPFSEPQSAAVVLANAFGLADAPDWIAQIVIELLFIDNTRANYVSFAQEAIRSSPELSIELEREPALVVVPTSHQPTNSRFVDIIAPKQKRSALKSSNMKIVRCSGFGVLKQKLSS